MRNKTASRRYTGDRAATQAIANPKRTRKAHYSGVEMRSPASARAPQKKNAGPGVSVVIYMKVRSRCGFGSMGGEGGSSRVGGRAPCRVRCAQRVTECAKVRQAGLFLARVDTECNEFGSAPTPADSAVPGRALAASAALLRSGRLASFLTPVFQRSSSDTVRGFYFEGPRFPCVPLKGRNWREKVGRLNPEGAFIWLWLFPVR